MRRLILVLLMAVCIGVAKGDMIFDDGVPHNIDYILLKKRPFDFSPP